MECGLQIISGISCAPLILPPALPLFRVEDGMLRFMTAKTLRGINAKILDAYASETTTSAPQTGWSEGGLLPFEFYYFLCRGSTNFVLFHNSSGRRYCRLSEAQHEEVSKCLLIGSAGYADIC
jgi:hypothetical protein